MAFISVGICLLLIACGAVAAGKEGSAVFELLTSNCPIAPFGTAAATVQTESECSLRCTLSCLCRLSVYLSDSAKCYSLTAMTPSSGICVAGRIARRKLSILPTSVFSLPFYSEIVMFYDFKKSFLNLANSAQYPAQPMNVSEQNCIDGVRLQGSSSSYVRVSTPGFYKYFFYGQSFSIFFQGKFSSGSVDKCISAFANINKNVYSSPIYAQRDGSLLAKIFFPNGTINYKQSVSKTALTLDSLERVVSIGINFQGEKFAAPTYLNGSPLQTGYESSKISSSFNMLDIHDDLLFGKCQMNGIEPFDGWLQCWSLLTGNLEMSQFDQLRSLCNP